MNTFILYLIIGLVWFIVFNASFSKISVISWLSVLLAEETGVPGQNYRPVANHWQTVSHDVVSSTSSHERDPNSQISLYITISCSIFDSNNMMAINYFGCKWLIDIKYLLEMSAMIFCPQSNEFWPIDFTFLACSKLTVIIHWPSYCTVHVYIIILFLIVCGCLEWNESVHFFVRLFILSLDIQLSRGEAWDPINRFNTAAFLCLSQAMTWIFNVILRDPFVFSELKWGVIVRFVDIGGIVDHHCLNFLFIYHMYLLFIFLSLCFISFSVPFSAFVFFIP